MSRMIPAEIWKETKSEGEKTLFTVLRDGLDDSFTVFHSFDLLTRNRENKFIEGEIDFLIFSSRLGLLVLEVKSGIIKYDGTRGIWYQNQRPLDKSPFEQAKSAKYQLFEFLEKRLGHRPPFKFCHAVCFPDVFSEIRNLPSGADPGLCITGPDLQYIGKTIAGIMDRFEKDQFYTTDRNEAERVRQVLMPYCEYGVKLSDRIKLEQQKLFALTENQCHCLDFIHNRKEALIEGCAGSGKTIMAMKKARELAAEGRSVLVLAFNLLLGRHLSNSLKDIPYITATTYHELCEENLRKGGCLPERGDEKKYYEKDIPQAFADWLRKNPIKFDAIIVDEGQDFRLEYWLTIEEMRKPEGYFYIFYDPAQNIFKTEMEFPILGPPFTLMDNCRNTHNIVDKLKELKPLPSVEMRPMEGAPVGEKVTSLSSPTERGRRRFLTSILHELIYEKKLDNKRIVILGAHSLGNTCIGKDPQIGNYFISQEDIDGPNIVRYYTYMKFKGCEADAVILIDVASDDERWADPLALYTAMSRARHLLYIIRKD